MILDPIAPSFLLVLVFPTCNRFGSKSRIPNFRYYDSQLIPFLLSTLRIFFFHQKEVTWVLCLELRTSTSRTGCHAQVLFCSRPHDLHQSLLLDYTNSRLCNSEGPLIPDLMIPPDVDLCLKCPLIPDLILQIPLVLNLTISNSLSLQIL